MVPSPYFSIFDKDDGLYLLLNESPPEISIIVEELGRMQIHVDPFVLSNKLRQHPGEEILIAPKDKPSSDTVSQNPIIVGISADKMRATLVADSKSNPAISVAELEMELKNAGVVYGINKDALLSFCNNPDKSIEAATGFAAVDGQDSVVVMYYHEPDKKPILLEDGRVDYYELGHIVSVHAGEIIGLRTPSTAGVEGYNVMGETLPPRPGKDASFPVGKGIIIIDDKAIAEYDGALSWDKNKISIIKMLTITGDVDFSIGNIYFPGKVLITGSVMEGFKVQADADIDIRGGVDDAEITSINGSVFVQRGIIGRGKAIIKAHKNVEAKFIQEAVVEAGHNIIVNEYVIRCDIKAGDSVLIQGRKGRIMGINNITAKTKIKASKIQNSAGLHLIVEGIHRSQYYDKVKELNTKIANIGKELTRLTNNIRQLENKTSDPTTLDRLQCLLPEYMQCNDDLEAFTAERNLITNMLKNTRGEGMIEIDSGLEHGMRLTIKDKSVHIGDNLSNLSMYFDPDAKGIKIIKNKK